jgi:hypothetical protein
VRTAQWTHAISVITIDILILYRKLMAVCCDIHTKQRNTMCGQNENFVNVKSGITQINQQTLKSVCTTCGPRKIFWPRCDSLCPARGPWIIETWGITDTRIILNKCTQNCTFFFMFFFPYFTQIILRTTQHVTILIGPPIQKKSSEFSNIFCNYFFKIIAARLVYKDIGQSRQWNLWETDL